MSWVINLNYSHFNPRSLAGATWKSCKEAYVSYDFNPRSLAGATFVLI